MKFLKKSIIKRYLKTNDLLEPLPRFELGTLALQVGSSFLVEKVLKNRQKN